MTRVKVCGITRREDLALAVDAGADAVGLTVDVPVDTPREIADDRAAALAAATPPLVSAVLVTMADGEDDVPRLADLVGAVRPDALQIHGRGSPADLAAIADAVPCRVIAAVEASDPDAAAYADGVDALLVDPAGEGGRGGTGRTADRNRARALREAVDVPVILAGGLTPSTVAGAIRAVRPFAVDVASGVEREGGVKDPEAVRAFVANAAGALEAMPP